MNQSQAENCDCYREDECNIPPNPVSTNYRNDPSYDAVLLIGQTTRFDPHSKEGLIITPDGK